MTGYLLYRDSAGGISRISSHLTNPGLLVQELEARLPATGRVLGIVLLPVYPTDAALPTHERQLSRGRP